MHVTHTPLPPLSTASLFCLAATGITGTIHHECMANPLVNTAEYRSMLKQRVIEAGRPTRTVQIINEGDKRGTFLAPGAAGGVPASGFGTFVVCMGVRCIYEREVETKGGGPVMKECWTGMVLMRDIRDIKEE